MSVWVGAAAFCLNEHGELLMVKQGKSHEQKKWSIPSGAREAGETLEECCVREVWEETGYHVKVVRKLIEKFGHTYGIDVYVYYFEVKLIGGKATIQDPDGLIHEIAWKSAEEIKELDLSFPDDRGMLLEWMKELGDS